MLAAPFAILISAFLMVGGVCVEACQKEASPRAGASSQSLASFRDFHNIAFLASDHATKLFHKMFPDTEIAKKISCGRTKTTAIVKEALAPHFLNETTKNMSYPFSLLMDESNDKTDKSWLEYSIQYCVIFVPDS